jgi:hypothetical protein
VPCYFFRENGGAHYLVRKDKVLDFFSEAIMRHFILSEQITTPGLLRKHASLFLQKKISILF